MTATKHSVFRFADVDVREREFSLVKAGETQAVEPKAFRVLLALLRNPGKLIPKQQLLDAVGGDAAVTENSPGAPYLRTALPSGDVGGKLAHQPMFTLNTTS